MKETLLQSDRGAALVVCIMLLIILSLLGSAAIMSTSTENKITHSFRKSGIAFYASDSGVERSAGVIDYFIDELPEAGDTDILRDDIESIINDAHFVNEVMGVEGEDNDGATDAPDNNPDLSTAIEDNDISVDIDRMNQDFAPGGNTEWGYEGGGSIGGANGVAVYYRVYSRGQYQDDNTSTFLESLYRKLL
ncbi:MAG TPA: PilX N-terminal domain-containing pilus assembly protein [Thermodesulfobacteriota bacterium]|nr:PilX N-terminal domain-containing pilus assembly protein [Thermodesulfobacteriota bacterium]